MEGAETEMNELRHTNEMDRQTSIKIAEHINPMLGGEEPQIPSYEPEEGMPASASGHSPPLQKQATER